MQKKETYLVSSTRVDRLHVAVWMPDEEPELIVQIAHGMIEHIGRYEDFARFLCSNGIGVVGHDHLGHGKTVSGSAQYGYFARRRGQDAVLADMHLVTRYILRQYPKCRLFLLGHSMGSFFSRRYLTCYGDRLSGAILMGTGHYTLAEAEAGKLLSGALMVARGGFYRSRLLEKLTIGGYSKYFASEACKSWLTRDAEQAARYEADPFCSFTFTASAYYQLFSLLADLAKHKDFAKIPKRLPIVLLSGENDPVGKFGKGVKQVYRDLKKQGIRDVRMKLYPQARHELLNETNRKEVYADILGWILRHASEGTKNE